MVVESIFGWSEEGVAVGLPELAVHGKTKEAFSETTIYRTKNRERFMGMLSRNRIVIPVKTDKRYLQVP